MIPEEMILEQAEKYGFQVPYDGSSEFYDRSAVKAYVAGAKWMQSEDNKLIGLLNQKINLLQIALKEIRDFDDDSEWDNPGEIAKQALTIK